MRKAFVGLVAGLALFASTASAGVGSDPYHCELTDAGIQCWTKQGKPCATYFDPLLQDLVVDCTGRSVQK